MQTCTARSKSSGARCKLAPIPGGTVCRFHGGSAPQVTAAARRRVAIEAITVEAARLGQIIDVSPLDAILEMVQEAAANVAALRAAVERLGLHVSGDRGDATGPAGVAVASSYDSRGRRDPAAPHILVAMYDAERDRLVRYSKTALDAGVDIKRLELAEDQARKLGRVIEAAIQSMNPTPEQRRAALSAAAETLRALNAGGA